jgi:hypothetical protein
MGFFRHFATRGALGFALAHGNLRALAEKKMLSQRHKDTKKKTEIRSHERLLYLCVFVSL